MRTKFTEKKNQNNLFCRVLSEKLLGNEFERGLCRRIGVTILKKYAVESKLGPKLAFFLNQNLVQFSQFFLLFFQKSSFCGETQNLKKNEQNKSPKKNIFFESKLGPILLRNMLGPSFDSTLDQVLTQQFC